jgi:large repetitive protein
LKSGCKAPANTFSSHAVLFFLFKRRHVRNIAARLSSFILALLLMTLSLAHAATPVAGVRINNQAKATFFDTSAGFFATLNSNTVVVIVQPVEAVQIRPAQTFIRSPGSFAVLPYRVTNSGNVSATYTLTFSNAAGDNFDVSGLTLYQDTNGNGVVDTGEPVLAPGATIALAPGQGFNLVLQGQIGAAVPLGQTALVNFTATSLAQGATRTVTDSLVTALGASMALQKTVSRLVAAPLDVLTYTLTAQNTGSATATGIPVSVDGNAAELVVVRDPIPANSAFVSLGAPGVGVRLYHTAGVDANIYTSTPPADLASVDAVGFGFAKIDAGQTVVRSFDVKINANASGDIVNRAKVGFNDGLSAGAASVDSNQTVTTVPKLQPTIAYFRDATFAQVINVAHTEQIAYVQANAAQCNLDAAKVESYTVIIKSAITGDVESFIATETGFNTGTFRIVPSITLTGQAGRPGDTVLNTAKNDILGATMLGCGANEINVNLLIDPYGVVYDGRTNAPVSGATVSLFNVSTNSPAVVFQADGVTPAPSTVVTGPNGQYEFPSVAPGSYKLLVTPPGGYSFPSLLPPSLLAAGRTTDPKGSYGGEFVVSLATGPVRIDVPLDASNLGGLFIEKIASRATVDLGEFVDYSVKIKNTSGQLLGQIQLEDHLPAGFAYVPNSARLNVGTVRLDGSRLPEPEGGVGPKLIFNAGSIQDGAVLTLSYRVRVGPGALQGDGINRAQAFSARITTGITTKISNIATAAVQVLPGVFSDRGFIVGKVFADCNRDRVQNAEERGIPDVRLYMEDGTFVITDAEGKFSLYNVRPQTHVLKIDATTLPQGAQLKVLDARNAGDAATRFIDMKKGQLLKANFAVDGCAAPVLEAIDLRAQRARAGSEVEFAVKARIPVDGVAPLVDVKGLPASGVVGMKTPLATGPVVKPSTASSVKPDASAERLDLDKLMPTLDASLQIVSPTDKQTFGVTQADVLVKGAAGSNFRLRVNGIEISQKRVGRKSVLESSGVQVWEYIGVDLKPGVNHIELEQIDSFGNVRGKTGAQVSAAGKFSKLSVQVPPTGIPADGRSMTEVTLLLTDAEGLPVKGRIPVTLEASVGTWQVEDLDKKEPGLQLFVEDGEARLMLMSPLDPGEAEIRATSGGIKAHALVKFLPELRPLIAAGVIEGAINFRNLNAQALQPTRAQDGFEQELRHFSRVSADGTRDAGARAALFLKGKVKGDYLLTLAYDSDKASKERLFRDIQPDEFYPVYGDDSVKGFDAQSTGLFYVRVDKGSSYALYGDYTTQSQTALSSGPTRQLSQYSRSLNGARTHLEGERGSLNAFAARTSSRSFTEEFPARGVSGYYPLGRAGIVPNSEKVEILTRDRNQPSVILKAVPLARFTDYEIEPLSGRLLFRNPIPTLDQNFNQTFIRVTYEFEQGGPQFWVYGVDGQVKLGDQVEVGGTYVRDQNPFDNFSMKGANVVVKLAEKTTLSAEVAQTSNVISGAGKGARVELKHEGEQLQAQVFAGKTTVGFDNPSALLSKGRAESGAKARLKIDDMTSLKVEAIRSEDGLTKGARDGALVIVERNLGDNVNGAVGLRHFKETAVPADATTLGVTPIEGTAAHFRLSGQVPSVPMLTVFGEYEQDIADSDKKMAAIGGEYALYERSKLYLRHELISSLGGRYSLNSTQQRNATVLGIDAGYLNDGRIFSEYRLRDALTGREAEAALGLRNYWTLAEGLRIQAGLEQIRTLNGIDHRSVAVTGGVEYTANPDWKGSARLEYRTDVSSRQLLGTVGLAYKVSNDWTFLGRNALQIQESKTVTGGSKTLERLQLGMAYRDSAVNEWDALGRYELKHESDSIAVINAKRTAHIVSTHLSYQPQAELAFSGRYAGKYVLEDSSGISSRYSAHLLSARADYDIAQDWTVGLNAGVLFSAGMRSRQGALGAELGRVLTKNLWLSVGYNRFGFRDDDLASEGYTSKGVFLRLRYKFDENAFK